MQVQRDRKFVLTGFAKSSQTPSGSALYAAVVERARAPIFFTKFGVADSVDGRFDLLALHAFLVLEALERGGAGTRALASAFTDVVFAGLEDALREMGVGDMGMSRRMKAMANAFFGRLEAYRAATSDAEMTDALLRNLYRGAPDADGQASAIAFYMSAARSHLATPESQGQLLSGIADFGPLPILQTP